MLVNMVQQISGKYKNRIDNLIEPLDKIYGVNAHAYYRIDSQGYLSYISNFPEIAEYYFSQELYKVNPFLKHPDLLESGFILPQAVENPEYQDSQSEIEKKFQLNSHLIIYEKEGDVVHAHGFATTRNDLTLLNVYINNLNRFQLYCRHFRQEMSIYENRMDEVKVDYAQLVGSQFFKCEGRKDHRMDDKASAEFFYWLNRMRGGLELMKPLSSREMDCLILLLKGKSANLIAEELQIKTRTVEHYVDNIKNKLMCSTKSELFSFVNTLKECGGELSYLQYSWR